MYQKNCKDGRFRLQTAIDESRAQNLISSDSIQIDVTVAIVAGDSIFQSIIPKTDGAPERTY